MNCPNCGKAMEPGWLCGKYPLLWTPKEDKRTLFKGREDVSLIDGSFPAAHICKDCRRVVLEYGKSSPYHQ